MNKNLKPFKPGQSGNPNGRPKTADDIRKASALTNEEFLRITNRFLLMTRDEIQAALQNPKASMLELLIGGIIAKATKEQDHQRATFLLDRTIGRAPIELTTTLVERREEVQRIIDVIPRDKLVDLVRIKQEQGSDE